MKKEGVLDMSEVFYKQLQKIVREDQVLFQEPLKKHTTFQIGGPASCLILPETKEQLIAVINTCKDSQQSFYVIGNGSNLLVSDQGFSGTIIKFGSNYSQIKIEAIKTETGMTEQYKVRAQAGVKLSKLAKEVADAELAGFEFAAGIPGTLGGAVTMNAGAYDGEIKQVILEATVIDSSGNLLVLNKEELELGYRESIIQKKQYIVVDALLQLSVGNKEDIFNKMIDLNHRRKEKQPIEYPSAGSTFKRPQGYYAGKLIMDAGLAGYQVGGAMISTKHCGFVINIDSATAKDVKQLIDHVIHVVYDKYQIQLEPEVRLLGDFL